MKSAVYNGKVITPEKVLNPGYVTIENGIITGTVEGVPPVELMLNSLDAQGGWIAPGLCDIHVHGNGGHWGFFAADDILNMARSVATQGVTSFVPTTVSLPHSGVLNSIKEIKAAMAKQSAGADTGDIQNEPLPEGARILGINLEGPYISPERPGAHNPLVIRPPLKNEIDEVLTTAGGAMRLVTLAPEIDGGMDFIDCLVKDGIVPVIGHSNATADQTVEAINRGATHFTHLFNAVRAFHHREPGCAFAALVNDGITTELILDNRHVHVDAAKVALKMKTPDRLVLITDSIHAAGLGDGEYNVWGFKVIVKDGLCRLEDGTIAGSLLTMNIAVKNAVELLEASPQDAFKMASLNPLRVLKMDNRLGTLEPGKIADIAVFDIDYNCTSTLIAGHVV